MPRRLCWTSVVRSSALVGRFLLGAVQPHLDQMQQFATCGHCGRRLHTHYRGRNSAPGYHCPGKILVEGRGVYCLNIGGIQIDEAVARAFIAALEPAKLSATLAAAERLETDRETSLKQWRLGVERASYEASRAERRYRAVDPDNRLVARGLEREWEESLSALEAAKAELARRESARPCVLSKDERNRLLALGADLTTVWHSETTTPRDRKELLRALIEEVIVKVARDNAPARLRDVRRAVRSMRSILHYHVRGLQRYTPMRTQSRSFAGWQSSIPTL